MDGEPSLSKNNNIITFIKIIMHHNYYITRSHQITGGSFPPYEFDFNNYYASNITIIYQIKPLAFKNYPKQYLLKIRPNTPNHLSRFHNKFVAR